MAQPIDPNRATPSEYLRWLQLKAARDPNAPGSWRSLQVSEALKYRDTLEARSQRDLNNLAAASGLEGNELETFRSRLEELREQTLSVEIPTGLGNPAFYLLLSDLVKDVEKAVARLRYEVPEKVTFGALPTGQFNGLACPVPTGGLIVALDDGVFTFFNLLAKAVATFFKIEANPEHGANASLVENDIRRAIATNKDGTRRWLEALVAMFVYHHPEFAPPRPLPAERWHIVDSLVTPSEMFIIAHEYAHLILRHYERNRGTSTHEVAADTEVETLQIRREEELEADRLGLEILREHHRQTGRSIDNTRMAIQFLSGCLSILENMWGQSPTHPTAVERSEKLLRQLAEEEDIAPDAFIYSRTIYIVMRELFFHNLDTYREWQALAIQGTVPWDDDTPYAGMNPINPG